MCLVRRLLLAATMHRDAARSIAPAWIDIKIVCGPRAPWREGRAPTSLPGRTPREDDSDDARDRERQSDREYERDRFTHDDDDRAGRHWRMRAGWRSACSLGRYVDGAATDAGGNWPLASRACAAPTPAWRARSASEFARDVASERER
jgi:hypothetical protein